MEVLVVLKIILISDENLSHASHGFIGPAWGPVQWQPVRELYPQMIGELNWIELYFHINTKYTYINYWSQGDEGSQRSWTHLSWAPINKADMTSVTQN